MYNWRYRLQQFMLGRYGLDQLGRFLLIVAIGVVFLSNFHRLRILYLPGLLLLAWAYVRIMSRNIGKRQWENQRFLAFRQRFSAGRRRKSGGFGNAGTGFSGRTGAGYSGSAGTGFSGNANTTDYMYYRCRNCGQTVRVPKGKGKLKITCPSCGNSFIDRT